MKLIYQYRKKCSKGSGIDISENGTGSGPVLEETDISDGGGRNKKAAIPLQEIKNPPLSG